MLFASVDVIPFLEASLEHFCRHPASLAGVAPSCVVPMCASALSSLWSVQLGCLVLPLSSGSSQRLLGRLHSSRRMLCRRCCLDEYFAADVARYFVTWSLADALPPCCLLILFGQILCHHNHLYSVDALPRGFISSVGSPCVVVIFLSGPLS